MGQRVAGGERGQRQCGGDGLVKLACFAQSSNQPMVRFCVRRIQSNGGSEGGRRFSGRAASQQVEAALKIRFGGLWIGYGHS